MTLALVALRFLTPIAIGVATMSAWAAPQTVLWYRSMPGDLVGQESTETVIPPASMLAAVRDGGRWAEFQWLASDSRFFLLSFAAPSGSTLAPGPYEEAARTPFAVMAPGLEVILAGRGCNAIQGRFVVLERSFGSDGRVISFAANFEQWCDNGPGPLLGEIRVNSEVPLSSAAAPGDAVPDPFALVAQSPVKPGTMVESNAIIVYGTNAPAAVSITGGEYSLNGAPFTTAAGTAQPLDRIRVRMRASGIPGVSSSATLEVGGQGATISVESFREGRELTGLYYRSEAGDFIGGGATKIQLVPGAAVVASRNHSNGAAFEATFKTTEVFNLNLSTADNVTVTPGTYEGARRWPFNGPVAPGLDFSGGGRGCNESAGRFVVHEAVYAPDGSIERFAADFEQRCEITGPPLHGEIRYRSTVPLSALLADPCLPGDDDGDGIPNCAEVALARDPGVKDNDIFSDARLFTMQQYRDFLAREGDSAGIDHWTAQFAGAMTRAQVVETFLRSAEFEGRIAPVTRLYFAYFRRIPDHGGLQHWIGQYAGGMSIEAISELFAQSAEFQGRYGALDDAQFVDLVYRSVMGRAPDATGLGFWTGRLARRELTRGEMMLAFSESAEYRAVIGAEVLVTMSYFGMLRRAPDDAGFAFWVGYLDAGRSPQALIDGFLRAPEYRARFLP